MHEPPTPAGDPACVQNALHTSLRRLSTHLAGRVDKQQRWADPEAVDDPGRGATGLCARLVLEHHLRRAGRGPVVRGRRGQVSSHGNGGVG